MRSVVAVLIGVLVSYGQKPVIAPGGVVNAASYATGGPTQKGLTRGSLVSIFGTNLAPTTQAASGFPLPTTLGGASVSVNGIPAPLLYVSPTQINAQLPSRYPLPFTGLQIVVSTATGESELAMLDAAENFGIFTADGSGCGQASALNVASDGTVSVNSAENAASPGGYISIFGTGISGFFNMPEDGSPALSEPLSRAMSDVLFSFDLAQFPPSTPLTGSSSWVGLAPGFAGVNQVNIRIPETVRDGCAVPLEISTGNGRSQQATISIRRGGGPCVDPATASFGELIWEKVVATGTSADGESETFTAAFPASPGKQVPPSIQWQGNLAFKRIDYSGPSCQLPGYRNLQAGNIKIEGTGLSPVEAAPTVVDGQVVYRAVLERGTIRPGSFSVTAGGGSEVGPFQSSARIGSGIQITSSLPPGTILPSTRPLVVNWSGGDPDTWVVMKIVRHLTSRVETIFVRAPTASGTIDFPVQAPGFLPGGPGTLAPTEVIIEVTPDPGDVPAILAPGLSLGGRHLWKYTYRFGGLTIQ